MEVWNYTFEHSVTVEDNEANIQVKVLVFQHIFAHIAQYAQN